MDLTNFKFSYGIKWLTVNLERVVNFNFSRSPLAENRVHFQKLIKSQVAGAVGGKRLADSLAKRIFLHA